MMIECKQHFVCTAPELQYTAMCDTREVLIAAQTHQSLDALFLLTGA